MLSQHVNVTFPFTVEEIVRMGAGDSPRAASHRLADAALHEVGLDGFRHRQLPTLSGGEQQRAHFARVLVQLACGEALHGPGLLLLDEPTSSLDLRHQIDLVETARRRAQNGTTVIAVFPTSIWRCGLPTASCCFIVANWRWMAAAPRR